MKYLSDKSVAERYDTSRNTIWRWVREAKLPKPIKLSDGTTRWKLSDLQCWEAKQEVA